MHAPVGLEWIIILVVIVLLFGAKKIPDLAKGLGEGLREFKKATRDDGNQPPQVADKTKVDEKAPEANKTEEKK